MHIFFLREFLTYQNLNLNLPKFLWPVVMGNSIIFVLTYLLIK
jgi:hypothetical protein